MEVTTPGTKTWAIPTDANGDSLRGTYSLKIWEEQTISDPDVQVKTQDESYYFKAHSNKADLSWSEICVPGVVGILTLVDAGDYSDLVETNRELKIVFPPEEGLADLTGSGTSLTINPHWTGVSYIGSVSAEYYTQNDDSVPVEWFEQYKFSGQLVKEFNCLSCEITDCIQEYAVKLAAKASLSQSDKDTMDRLSIYEIAYRSAKNCGNLADAAAWATKIKALLDCDCGCSETSSGAAAPFETAIFDDLLSSVSDEFVHISGAETILGAKTFSAQPIGIAGVSIVNTPSGNIAATTSQAAINELDSEKQKNILFRNNSVSLGTSGGISQVNINGDGVTAFNSGSSITYEIDSSTPSSWTLIEASDTFGSAWDTTTNTSPQLQWRRIGNSHIELMGYVGKSGLTAGTAPTIMLGYFKNLGITLKSFYGLPVTLAENGGSPAMQYGGGLTVQYSGSNDNIAIHISPDLTPSGTMRFYVHAFIPIEP